jgi:AcrR family transcriptional regulator
MPAMATPKPTRPRRRPPDRYNHGDLRRALIHEAVRVIRTHGTAGLTLRGVGDRLGVSRTALYRHFADKQALLGEVAADGFRTLRGDLLEAWENGGRGSAALDAMGVAYVRFAIAQPSHYRVMFGGVVEERASRGAAADESTDAFRVLVEAIAALQRTGRLRPDDPQTLALYIWAVVHGLAMLALDGVLPDGVDPLALVDFANARLHGGIDA